MALLMTSTLPLITITDATPRKTPVAQPPVGLSTPTSAPTSDATAASPGNGADSPYRLLYRGALSLPDSYLQLDGITFSARLPSRHAVALQDSPSYSLARADASARELMYNPLALALESMRGRQSLRFKGTVSLQDVWMDDTGEVYMDIHPFATLTRVYFENVLCLSELAALPHDAFGPRRTQVGVRVSLGDTDGPETTDIVIYGETSTALHPPPPLQLSSAATSTSAGLPLLNVRVARITPAPRAPRPDDPTPRQPPVHLFDASMLRDLGRNKRITPRASMDHDKGKDEGEDLVLRRAREVMLHLPRSDTTGRCKGKAKMTGEHDAAFKVPELPAKVRRKQGGAGTDVFGTVRLPPSQPRPHTNGKGKGKESVPEGDTAIANPIEDANKLALKKVAVRCLSNAGVPRSHSEFKDIFGFVYRGAAFALRSQAKTAPISTQAAEAVVEAHVKMYVLTVGGTHASSGG